MERVKGLAMVASLVMVAMVVAASSVAEAQTICNVPLSGLMACKPAVTPPNPPPPTSGCCSALSHADMGCLCSYKNSKLLPSLGIDPKLAVKLPTLCKLPQRPNC